MVYFYMLLYKFSETQFIVFFRFNYENDRFTELTGVLEEIFRLNAPFAKENFFPITRWFPSGQEVIICMFENKKV